MARIDFAQTRRELDLIVADYGAEYIYEFRRDDETGLDSTSCYYVHGDSPGCIVGVWLNRFRGVELDRLDEFENEPVDNIIPRMSGLGIITDYVTTDAIDLLRAVQTLQDQQTPWGECVRQAVRDAEELGRTD